MDQERPLCICVKLQIGMAGLKRLAFTPVLSGLKGKASGMDSFDHKMSK